jgi:ABC-type transport system involved in multi-copper enzyme maturation permease subunit
MFAKIAAFEFRYQLRQPIFWIVALIFFLLTFGSITVDQIQIGSGGNVHKNSPVAINQTTIIWTLFFMFVTTAFVANVVVRDDETGYGPIVRSTRIRKFDYLIGRFVGAFAVAALCFLSVPLAIMAGSVMPWVDPETLGPIRLAHYAFAYFVFALPGIFLTSALFFALATVTRSMMYTYVGAVAFLIGYLVLNALLARPEFEQAVALLEPFGAAAYGAATEYWTAAERNTRNPAFEGALLYNRLIWIAVGLGILALAYSLFRFGVRGAKAKKSDKLARLAEQEPPSAPVAGPLPKPRFDRATAWAQLVARTRFEMAQVFKSPAFFVLLFLGVGNSMGSLWFAGEFYGTEIRPVTRVMISVLVSAFSLIPIIIAIYYAGELVWRERDRKTAEIIDATAVPDWAFLLPKTLAITLVLVSTLLVSVLTAMIVQLLKGHTDLEPGKYLLWYVLPQALDWTLLAALAIFIQALVPHKFIGWGLMLLYLIASW